MSISFRYARPEELEEIVRLTGHSFPGVARDREWWMERYRQTDYGDGPEILWVGEEEGRLVASCQLHRITHSLGGAEFPSMGLGTVAIAPTHRRRGLAGRMVSTALQAAEARGDLLSSLYPFRASFYGRYGYGLCGESHQYHLPPKAFPPSDTREAIELLTAPADVPELTLLYERWIRSQTGQVKRSELQWERIAAGANQLLVGFRGTDGRLEGYALASYPTHLPPHERFLSVEEHAWLTPEARRGLYGWLSSLGDQWRGVALRVLPEHRLQDWLPEPRITGQPAQQWRLWFPSAILLRGPMFRVLDVEKAASMRTTDPAVSLTVALELGDEHLPGNSGSWSLRISGGRLSPSRSPANAHLRLRLGIQAFSRLFMGSLPATAAVAAGLAEADAPERLPELDRAFAVPECWTFDRY